MKALDPAIVSDRTEVFMLDAVRFSLEMGRTTFARLVRALRVIERSDDSKPPSDAVALRAIEAAWSLCDSAHRVRCLVVQVRGLSHNDPQVQLFLRAAKSVEDVRNHLQHLSSGIRTLGESTVPLMGQLRWKYRSGAGGCALSVGHWTKGTHGLTPVLDLRTMSLVDGVWFSVGDSTLDLEELHSRCRRLSQHLEAWLKASGRLGGQVTRPSTFRFRGPQKAGT